MLSVLIPSLNIFYFHRVGPSQASCQSLQDGGECSGTIPECEDCNKVKLWKFLHIFYYYSFTGCWLWGASHHHNHNNYHNTSYHTDNNSTTKPQLLCLQIRVQEQRWVQGDLHRSSPSWQYRGVLPSLQWNMYWDTSRVHWLQPSGLFRYCIAVKINPTEMIDSSTTLWQRQCQLSRQRRWRLAGRVCPLPRGLLWRRQLSLCSQLWPGGCRWGWGWGCLWQWCWQWWYSEHIWQLSKSYQPCTKW